MKEAGLKVGCFTSPHLVDFRERICVNGKMIEKEEVTRIGNELLALEPDVAPTMFDYCLVMAVIIFRSSIVMWQFLRPGLVEDSVLTNALGKPDVAVITRIGYDHMAILGNTLTEIASEKSRHFKAGCSGGHCAAGRRSIAGAEKIRCLFCYRTGCA